MDCGLTKMAERFKHTKHFFIFILLKIFVALDSLASPLLHRALSKLMNDNSFETVAPVVPPVFLIQVVRERACKTRRKSRFEGTMPTKKCLGLDPG